ncbi:hypothetical protein ACQEVG_18570 [Streptomyces sp. CA-135486]|uniref:hypothetical protein n=1 Tax=Streptomyces sp. CA-135486 TaxID=3240049 RepID=UPI003D925FCD
MLLTYVLNVIEDPQERRKTLKEAWGLAETLLIASARLTWEKSEVRGEAFGDGLLTSRQTLLWGFRPCCPTAYAKLAAYGASAREAETRGSAGVIWNMALAAPTTGVAGPGIVEQVGALLFGVVLGWFLYYVNRHRDDKIGLRDVGTLISTLGGGAMMSLFPDGGRLFGWYSIGVAAGFFAYLVVLLLTIRKSPGFTIDFLLDGRAPALGGQRQTRQRPLAGEALQGLQKAD